MARKKVGSVDIGAIINLVILAGVGFGAYKVYQLFGGGSGAPDAPKGTSPFTGTQIPIATTGNGASVNKETALDWVDNYINSRGVSDPFGPGLYNSNPDASTMDYATLTALAGNIKNMEPGFWGNLVKNGMDGNALFTMIQQYCPTQVDVSNLSIVFQQLYGVDLLTWLWDPARMANGYFTYGLSDIEWMKKIIQYVLALPVQ